MGKRWGPGVMELSSRKKKISKEMKRKGAPQLNVQEKWDWEDKLWRKPFCGIT